MVIVVLMLLVLMILLPSSDDSSQSSLPRSVDSVDPSVERRSIPANMSKSVAYLDVSLRCVDAVDSFDPTTGIGRLQRNVGRLSVD